MLAGDPVPAMGAVSPDDPADEVVPDDVRVVELAEGDSGGLVECLPCLDEAGFAGPGEVDLRRIAGDDALGAGAEAGEEHEHLLGCRVLRFVENDEALA